MSVAPAPVDLGGYSFGDYAAETIQFTRNGSPVAPGNGPFLKATPPGGVETDYSSQLVDQGNGAHLFVLPTNVSGGWTARAWSTGAGQTSRDLVWSVASTRNP